MNDVISGTTLPSAGKGKKEVAGIRGPVNVLVVVRWPVGGIRTFIRYVFSGWTGEKPRLTVVLPDASEVAALKEDLEGFDVRWRVVEHDVSPMGMMRHVSSALRENAFDIVHAHGFTSALCTALPLVRHRNRLSIVTSHDVLLSAQLSGIKGKLKRFLLARALNRFDVIHSVSNDAQCNLVATVPGVNRRKCTVILNGIEPERFLVAEPRDLRKELDIDSDTILLGFFGRFMAQKGFRYLVDAMELLSREQGHKFRVVCFGWGGFVREEQQALREKGLQNLFEFVPFVPNVAGSMKGLDAVVMPSLWEACPLLPMEALTAGVPLVATSCIGLREVCQDTPAVIVEPANAGALRDGILKAISIPREQAAAFAETAAARFDVAETVKGIRGLYSGGIEV